MLRVGALFDLDCHIFRGQVAVIKIRNLSYLAVCLGEWMSKRAVPRLTVWMRVNKAHFDTGGQTGRQEQALWIVLLAGRNFGLTIALPATKDRLSAEEAEDMMPRKASIILCHVGQVQ